MNLKQTVKDFETEEKGLEIRLERVREILIQLRKMDGALYPVLMGKRAFVRKEAAEKPPGYRKLRAHIPKTCLACGKPFRARRKSQMYDSTACRSRALRLRAAEKPARERKRIGMVPDKLVSSKPFSKLEKTLHGHVKKYLRICALPGCRKNFMAAKPWAQFCSKEHRHEAGNIDPAKLFMHPPFRKDSRAVKELGQKAMMSREEQREMKAKQKPVTLLKGDPLVPAGV